MIALFKRIFDWVQSGPVDFNIVTGEWGFKKEPKREHKPLPPSEWKRVRVRIARRLGWLQCEDRKVIDAYLGINKEEEPHPGTFKRH
jgi:hypothetical protein